MLVLEEEVVDGTIEGMKNLFLTDNNTVVQRQIFYQNYFLDNRVNNYIYHTIKQRSMLMTLNIFSILKFYYDSNKALFYKVKINSHGIHVINKEIKGIFCTFLRRVYVIHLTHMLTVVNKIF